MEKKMVNALIKAAIQAPVVTVLIFAAHTFTFNEQPNNNQPSDSSNERNPEKKEERNNQTEKNNNGDKYNKKYLKSIKSKNCWNDQGEPIENCSDCGEPHQIVPNCTPNRPEPKNELPDSTNQQVKIETPGEAPIPSKCKPRETFDIQEFAFIGSKNYILSGNENNCRASQIQTDFAQPYYKIQIGDAVFCQKNIEKTIIEKDEEIEQLLNSYIAVHKLKKNKFKNNIKKQISILKEQKINVIFSDVSNHENEKNIPTYELNRSKMTDICKEFDKEFEKQKTPKEKEEFNKYLPFCECNDK